LCCGGIVASTPQESCVGFYVLIRVEVKKDVEFLVAFFVLSMEPDTILDSLFTPFFD
jgi:hypothetical protein